MRILYFLGVLALLVSCTEQSTKPVQCHITGTVIDRPESKVLELYTHIDGEVAVSSRPVAEIKIRDGKFAYDLVLDEADYCTLSFAEEKARGSWFPIHFIADGDTVRLTHEQIAKYMGSAREVVSRMLKYFATEGLISASRSEGIRILDKRRLRELTL